MTETAPVSWQSTPGTPLERLVATVGRIHPHVECKVVDPVTEETLPVGMTGELRTRGYNVMPCYFNNPEATVNRVLYCNSNCRPVEPFTLKFRGGSDSG